MLLGLASQIRLSLPAKYAQAESQVRALWLWALSFLTSWTVLLSPRGITSPCLEWWRTVANLLACRPVPHFAVKERAVTITASSLGKYSQLDPHFLIIHQRVGLKKNVYNSPIGPRVLLRRNRKQHAQLCIKPGSSI
jgi:hypothetical protein